MDLKTFETRLYRMSRISAWIALAVIVLCALIALLAPEDTLARSSNMAAFTDAIAHVFPVTDRYASRSAFPEVTKLYMSTMFAASPLAFLAALCSLYPDRQFFVPIQNSDTRAIPMGKHIFSAVAFTFLLPVLVYFHLFINPGLDIWFMNFSTSRESLALFGVFITLAVPFMVGGTLALATRLLLGIKEVCSDVQK